MPFHTVLLSSHIHCIGVNHSAEDLICAGRDLGYPKAIVSDQTKWKIQCGFSCLLPWLQGCYKLWVPAFFYPYPPCLFLIRWLVQEWRGLRLLLLPLLMTLSSFGKPHVHTTQEHTAASMDIHTHAPIQAIQHRQSVVIYTCMHIQSHQHMHELAHMHAHTVQAPHIHSGKNAHYTSERRVSLFCLRSLSVSLTQHCQFLDSSSDLPCLIVSCDLSCEISDTRTDACLF